MLKRLASMAAASLLAGAALLGSGATVTTAGSNWESETTFSDSGDFVQPTNGSNWE